MTNWLSRLLCFFLGHKWLWRKWNPSKHIGLVHLCADAGLDMDCERCGYQWRDTLPWVHAEVFDVPESHLRAFQRRLWP